MMETPASILVVDDEDTTRTTLSEILRLEGYQVDAVANGTEALKRMASHNYDVMLLDLIMPGMNGLEVLEHTRANGWDMEVVFLTAHSSVESAVGALRYGAADYLLKPAAPAEIIGAVRKALERRQRRLKQQQLLEQLEMSVKALRDEGNTTASASDDANHYLSLPQGAWVDPLRRKVYYQSREISLSPTETRLLQTLIEHAGKVLRHDELVQMVQGYEVSPAEAPEMLRPLISRLRAKLALIPGGKDWIVNVRGVGYGLELPQQ